MLKNLRHGFTLIEILIVIAIIGLLSSLLLPNIAGAQNKAKEAAVKAIMFNLQTELEGYQIEHFTYPQGNNLSLVELASLLNLKKIPSNPFSGQEYQANETSGQILYSFDNNTGTYQLCGYKRDNQTVLYLLTNG